MSTAASPAPAAAAGGAGGLGTPMLTVRDLRVAYGAIEAVKGISFDVHQGQVVTLIGGNGAGKTTTLRTISGLLRSKGGEIVFEGDRIDRRPGHLILRKGIAHSPEGRRIFGQMTIRENLDLGAHTRSDDGIESDVARVFELFPVLGERRTQKAGTLSGGEQKMLLMSRAMLARPRLMLLDEISEGLQPSVIDRLAALLIAQRRDHGTAILLVEQNVALALATADRFAVLTSGVVVERGGAADAGAAARIQQHMKV